MRNEIVLGALAMITACTVWGLSPLFYKHLVHVPPLEILSHRIVWSVVIFLGYQFLKGRVGRILDLINSRKEMPLVLLASLMVSINWFLFVWSVQTTA